MRGSLKDLGLRTLSVVEKNSLLPLCLLKYNLRIVGGCFASHIPWYVFIKLNQSPSCGGVLINKVGDQTFSISSDEKLTVSWQMWVLSAAHCFCSKTHNLPCTRYKNKNGRWRWRLDYNITDFRKIEVTWQYTQHTRNNYSSHIVVFLLCDNYRTDILVSGLSWSG